MRALVSLTIALIVSPALAGAQPVDQPAPAPSSEPAPPEPAPPEPPPAPAPPSTNVIAAPAVIEAPHERWFTYEASVGGGVLTGLGRSEVLRGASGLDGGAGLFVTQQLAISLRLAGLTDLKSGILYIGMVGPHLQFWFGPRVWAGAGLGYGFYGGCSTGCAGGLLSTSYEFRFGVTADDRGPLANVNLAAEIAAIPVGGGFSATTLALMLGYQHY